MTSMKLTTLATALAIAIPVYAQNADTPPNNQQSTPQENVKEKSTEPKEEGIEKEIIPQTVQRRSPYAKEEPQTTPDKD